MLQSLVVISGMVPLCLLARTFCFTRLQTLCFGLMYCFYPAFMGGCFYDFHENKFLAVIILWCMYFLETGHFKSMLASAALLLMVKEDAPVYAACIGLYLFLWKNSTVGEPLSFLRHAHISAWLSGISTGLGTGP